MKKQLGYTLFELFFILITIAALAGMASVIYVGVHFISKFW